MKMNRIRNVQKLLVVLMLVVMLIPMLALSAYASVKVGYRFNFNYSGYAEPQKAWKNDKGYSAGASILDGYFNGGSVNFQLQRYSGSDLSYWSGPYTVTGSKILYYYSNVDLSNVSQSSQMAVQLASSATSAVSWISGNFQP